MADYQTAPKREFNIEKSRTQVIKYQEMCYDSFIDYLCLYSSFFTEPTNILIETIILLINYCFLFQDDRPCELTIFAGIPAIATSGSAIFLTTTALAPIATLSVT